MTSESGYEIKYYAKAGTESPFATWRSNLQRELKSAVDRRLDRLSQGNFGDHRSVGGGVVELRLHIGPGIRIYVGRFGKRLVVLLHGGTKATQADDIACAKAYWQDWKTHQGAKSD